MKLMPVNWNGLVTAFALVTAFSGLRATVAAPQSDTSAAAPALPEAAPADKAARGGKLEARLKQIVLPEVGFNGLPLSEVLRFLCDESAKRDPDRAGINFLINPNFRPVALTGAVDPATGLPLAVATQPFDVAGVIIKFNLPLRNVTMKDLLDAIVMVADQPIEYSLEDYAVVFSARPETVAGQPVVVAQPAMLPTPGQVCAPRLVFVPGGRPQPKSSDMAAEPRRKPRITNAALALIKPQTFNIDFGPSEPSKQVGPAAVGQAGDFWNVVSVGFNDHHTATDLRFAGGNPSPIEVEMVNLGGAWGVPGASGGKSPMLEDYNYPTCNRGGNSTVILHQVPAGKYRVYLYGAGATPGYYGDYSVSVAGREYGRKQTTRKGDAFGKSKWVEGSQYVRFSNVKVGPGEGVTILIRPGDPVTDSSGRTFSDAFIAGLQLLPVK